MAPVGHSATQAGEPQWLHSSGLNASFTLGNVPEGRYTRSPSGDTTRPQ